MFHEGLEREIFGEGAETSISSYEVKRREHKPLLFLFLESSLTTDFLAEPKQDWIPRKFREIMMKDEEEEGERQAGPNRGWRH